MNYVKKYCANFQNDWSSRFWVMMYTDFKNNKFQKNALKYRRSNYTYVSNRHIALRRIQVCWRDNTIYSHRKQNIMPVITMHAIELSRVIHKAIYCLNIFVFLFIYLHFFTYSYIYYNTLHINIYSLKIYLYVWNENLIVFADHK